MAHIKTIGGNIDKQYFREYVTLVAEAGRFHGDICTGIEISTRMSMSGVKRIGILDPKGDGPEKT